MGLRGPAPKSTESLKIAGTFKPSRHADREASEVKVPIALPSEPEDLDEVAKSHWRRIVEHIGSTGVVGEIDAEAIESAARYWSLWKKAIKACENAPTDRNSRMNAIAFGEQWMKLAAKLGLNPVDRTRLKAPKQDEKKGVASRKRA